SVHPKLNEHAHDVLQIAVTDRERSETEAHAEPQHRYLNEQDRQKKERRRRFHRRAGGREELPVEIKTDENDELDEERNDLRKHDRKGHDEARKINFSENV